MLSIVHVDDNRDYLDILSDMCKFHMPVVIRSIESPEEFDLHGLTLTEFGEADVLIVDYDLKSKKNGCDIVRKALMLKPKILIIANSGLEESNAELIRAGAHVSISKGDDLKLHKITALIKALATIKLKGAEWDG